MTKKPKHPRDSNQLAKRIIDIATGNKDDVPAEKEKNPAAVALGRLGGKKGEKARSIALTDERKKEIATKAAKARWKK